MSQHIAVTSEDLLNLSSQVSSGAHQIQTELGTLQGQVHAVVGNDWQGAASGQFHTLWEEWERSAKGLHEALAGISHLLNHAGSSYQETENAIRAGMV